MNDNGIAPNWSTFYNAGMRGRKGTSWQGGWRALSFWRWPGQWKPHAVTQLTAHLDVLPTLCDLTGAPIPAELKPKLQGFSLRPLLENDRNPAWAHDDRMIFQNVGRWPDGQAAAHKYSGAAVIQGHYLCISASDDFKATPSQTANWRLFDLSGDMACRKNLVPQEPELTRKLATAYDAWWNATYPDLVKWGGDGPKAAAAFQKHERKNRKKKSPHEP
jgi:arylsulfatase A-like enzyme